MTLVVVTSLTTVCRQVKVWQVPADGLQENLTDWLVDLHGHTRRVGQIEWHPTAENILLSSGYDHSVSQQLPHFSDLACLILVALVAYRLFSQCIVCWRSLLYVLAVCRLFSYFVVCSRSVSSVLVVCRLFW